jgi:hypothetical protein
MAKLQNNFLKSKMNKDLDDRLVPTGEYRDALNITVGKSESSSVGTAQNILGNTSISAFTIPSDAKCIGKIENDSKNIAIFFITDYTDVSETQINDAGDTSYCSIILVDFNNPSNITSSVLVEGYWLNFAANNQYTITGVNLIENLLFWTDDRNQPRKINIDTALATPGYYTTEHQISVAKYAPIEAIQLFKKIDTKINQADATSVLTFTVDSVAGITVGMFMISSSVEGDDYVQVTAVDAITNEVTVSTGAASFLGVDVIDNQDVSFLASTMTDQSSDISWSGDPDYLESRYVRFSYRIRYDDNEYSTFAPFTQICFIPKQKGYFTNGDEESALRSTIVDWFENNINNIELLISLPTIGSRLIADYNVSDIDILYKESEGLIVSVLKTISADEIASSTYANTNIFPYTYKSSKPYKTLPEAQTVRVYDKVPVRARAQEVSGNRVIYGNYRDAWTSPNPINYNVSVQGKTDEFTNFIEYPNHTLKQNRNYQVGFILADKYNRQSSVVLSSNDDSVQSSGQFFGGSTVYSPYENDQLNVKKWFGNALRVLVNTPILVSDNTQAGTPGLYANPTSTGNGFAITNTATISGSVYTFNLDTSYPTQNQAPEVGDYMRGQFTDYVEVLTKTGTGPYVITTSGQVNSLYLFDDLQGSVANTRFAYDINARGWYSYKVVVKQQEQQYYNSYLPGMLNGYPKGQTSGSNVLTIQTEIIPALNNVSSGSTITFAVSTGAQNIITGMTVQNLNAAFGTADSVLVTDVVVNAGNISVTVDRQVTVTAGDLIKFIYPQSVTQYGVDTTSFPVNEINKTAHVVLINDNINKIPRDLTEVGPDQKQFRSSVELYGRVENFGLTLPMAPGTSIEEQNTQKTDKIEYDPATASGIEILATITAGDSMTALDGGNAIQDLYPNNWLKDTVVVSNELNAVGTNATITFTPPQLIYGNPNPTTEFEFVKEENKQYYPARKADTVNTISTATDLNFISNGVENIRGSAALNLYQLESNPLVARISTVNAIGETTGEMIPFLSVYETKPVESQLEIFWETASTGLISDLNDDVLTGFDGPVGFTATGYRHFEDQDPSSTGTATGDPDSAYITDEFTAVNNSGSPLVGSTTLALTSVFDRANNNRSSDFELEATGSPGEYRLKIKENPSIPFVFNRNARTFQEYIFNIEVSFDSQGQTLTETLQTTGKLGNIQPIIVNGCDSYSVTIDQQTTAVTTVDAKNGAFQSTGADVESDIFYEIISGDTYFNINQSGDITVDLPAGTIVLPIGVYTLEIQVTDAYSGDALTGDTSLQFNSISTNCDAQSIIITVGQEKTPGGFHIDTTGVFAGDVLNYRGFQYSGSGENGYYDTTFDPSITGYGEGTSFGSTCSPTIQPGGNPGVIRMCVTNTVSNRIARPTTLGDSSSSGAAGNVKFAVLYMGPRSIDINTDPTSNTMGVNNGSAVLPTVDSNDYVIPLDPNGNSWSTSGPFAAGINLEKENAPAGIPVGLISGQVLVTNKAIADGDWSNNVINFNRSTLQAGKVELDYKIYRRAQITDLQTGDVSYGANTAAAWQRVSDINKSVPTNGWGNACTGSTTSVNNLFAKVQFSSQKQTNAQQARVASREDSFVLDGTAFPGEYCIIYRFKNTPFQTPALIDSSAGGVWYPTGESRGGTISVGVQDLNFKYDGSVPTGELRFPPTTGPAQFSVNPTYSPSVPGAFPVGYSSQFTTTAPFDDDIAKVIFQNYELAQAASAGDTELVFTQASITANGVSPYLNVNSATIGIQVDTSIIIINVDGNPNKVELNKAITSSISAGTTISMGRVSNILLPFSTNPNTTIYSTVGRVNTVSQFFYDAACTQVFDVINNDNSGSLFKLYNQNTNGPNYLDYSTASDNSNPVPPTDWDAFMPLPADTPIGSVMLDDGGNVIYPGSGSFRGLSPIAQDLKA